MCYICKISFENKSHDRHLSYPPSRTASQTRLSRSKKRTSAFFLVIVILALGIGTNTAVFSVIDAVLLRQLPYGDPNRLVVVWEKNPALGKSIGERIPVSYATSTNGCDKAKSFEDIAGFESVNLNRTGDGNPERIDGGRVSPNFFELFSVNPALETTLASVNSDPGNTRIAMLGDAYWHTHFGGSRSVIGQPITLNDSVYTIVGVFPAGFYLPSTRARAPINESPRFEFLTTLPPRAIWKSSTIARCSSLHVSLQASLFNRHASRWTESHATAYEVHRRGLARPGARQRTDS